MAARLKPSMQRCAKYLLFVAVLGVVPTVLLVLGAEAALRVFGFGYDTTPLIRHRDSGAEYWVGNPDFTRLFFPAHLKRLPPHVRVPANKSPSTRRYMIVGGSAAAGDPDTDFSIARNLEWLLDTARPNIDHEVINLAYTACNSHVAREVVRQSAAYDLDGIIVLVGNNEVIGPFGPGTTLTDVAPSARSREWQLRLRKTKLGQLGQVIRENWTAGPNEDQAWRGMQHFLEHRIAADDPRLESVYANFKANLEAIEEDARARGIPVLLASVPVNLADQPPFHDAAENLPSDLSAAVRAFMESGTPGMDASAAVRAAEAYPKSAYMAFMAGSLLLAEQRHAEANLWLRRAADRDQLRFRADSRINALIRDQWSRPDTAWVAVDSEAPLIADSPRATLGFPHFYEHVHLSLRANFLIARAMAEAILAREGADAHPAQAADWSQAASALGYTTYDAWRILVEMEKRFGEPPFTDIPGYSRITGWMDTLRETLERRVSLAEEKSAIQATYLAALDARPNDRIILLNLAHFYAAFGRHQAAWEIVNDLFPRNPTDIETAILFLNLSATLNKADEATRALRRVEAIYPEHPGIANLRERVAAIRTSGK